MCVQQQSSSWMRRSLSLVVPPKLSSVLPAESARPESKSVIGIYIYHSINT